MKNFLLSLLIFCFGKVAAQNVAILHGRVFNDTIPLAGVHIQNIENQIYTTTNADGYFSIKANIGNTLQFTYIGMQFVIRKIVKQDFEFAGIQVRMKEDVVELDAVEVSKYQKITAQDLGILEHKPIERTFAEKRLYTSRGGGGAIIDGLINAITGRTKMLKKVVKNEQNTHIAMYIRENMADFLKKELKLNDEQIELLAFYVMENSEIHQAVAKKEDGTLKFLLTDIWGKFQKLSENE